MSPRSFAVSISRLYQGEQHKDCSEYRILDGVHRFEAYSLRRDVYTKNLVGDFYDKPLPPISDTELNTIPCFVDNVPPGMDAMIFCLLKNQKHGKPPTSEDYRKVARELFKKNVGAPIQGLAEQIKISRKVFTKYVSGLVKVFKEEKKASILELNSAGTPATKISHILQEKFHDA